MLRSFSSFYSLALVIVLIALQGCGGGGGSEPPTQSEVSNLTEMRLQSLSINIGDFEPVFDPDNLGPYTLNVGNEVDSVTVSATAMSENTELRVQLKDTNVLDSDNNSDIYDERVIASGETDTRVLNPGDNRIVVAVAEPGQARRLEYQLVIHRENVLGSLDDLIVFYPDSGRMVESTLTPTFAADQTSYTGTLPYSACYYYIRAIPTDRHTVVSFNGEVMEDPTVIQVANIGEQVLQFSTTPEAGNDSRNYSLTLTREAGTAAQIAEDASLASLTTENTNISEFFHCQNGTLSGSVNKNVSEVIVTAQPTVSSATMRIGSAVFESSDLNRNGLVDLIGVSEEDAVELVAGTPFTLAFDAEETSLQRVIEVTAADGESVQLYRLSLVRLSTNLVSVASASELQTALQNAQPGDEIVIQPGVYEGIAALAESGNDNAHFYSAQSGTADSNILLHGFYTVDPSKKVVLSGGDDSAAAVLRLDGDYWLVSNIEFTGAGVGVVFDSAEHNQLDDSEIYGVAAQGLVLRNGSSDNVIRDCKIYNTGAEGIVVGSSAALWDTAPEGTYDPNNARNAIHFNSFGPDIAAEAVDIKEGAEGTLVQSNTFDSNGISAQAELGSLVVVKGNDTNISYNTFLGDASTPLTAVVSTNTVTEDWVVDNWGVNSLFYQNWIDLAGKAVPVVSSELAFSVGDNRRLDDAALTTTGAGVDSSYTTPTYKIKYAADDSMCIADFKPLDSQLAGAANYDARELSYLALADCSVAQSWTFTHSGLGFAYLSPAGYSSGENGRIIIPMSSRVVFGTVATSSVIAGVSYNFDAPSQGYNISWKLVYSEGEMILENRQIWAGHYAITTSDEAEMPMYLIGTAGLESQRFILEQQ